MPSNSKYKHKNYNSILIIPKLALYSRVGNRVPRALFIFISNYWNVYRQKTFMTYYTKLLLSLLFSVMHRWKDPVWPKSLPKTLGKDAECLKINCIHNCCKDVQCLLITMNINLWNLPALTLRRLLMLLKATNITESSNK